MQVFRIIQFESQGASENLSKPLTLIKTIRKGGAMNGRKPVDYGEMHQELTVILAQIFRRWTKSMALARLSASARRRARRSQPQSFYRLIFLTARAFLHATFAECAFFYKTYKNDQKLLWQKIK